MNRLFRFLVPLILAAGTVAVGQDSNNADVPKPAPEVQRVRVSSGVAVGLLIKKVQPNYPEEARQARIQGRVVLQAEISKDGIVQNLQLVSGPPMLAAAAIHAVKKWTYKPYQYQGNPVAMETQVVVDFQLPGAERVSEMQPGIQIPASSSDSEVKIEQGGRMLVRSEGSQEWKLGEELTEPIVVGLLDGDHKIYVITKAIKPPKGKRTKDPAYPKDLRSSAREGQVLLHMVIDERGSVRFPTVDASADQQFTGSAIEAVKKWTFESAKLNGQPVAVLVDAKIIFRLP